MTRTQPNEADRPAMGKIMSFGYARDWEDERDDWDSKQTKSDKRGRMESSEYQSSMAAGTPPIRSAKAQRRTVTSGNKAT